MSTHRRQQRNKNNDDWRESTIERSDRPQYEYSDASQSILLDEGEDLEEDPYNRPRSTTPADQLVEQHYYLSDAMDEQQLAYDSMSTILEVDSEGSETSDRRLESPLQVRTSRSPKPEHPTGTYRRRGREKTEDEGIVSPISEDIAHEKFSGTLSALAAQVERLRSRQPSEEASKLRDSPISETATSTESKNLTGAGSSSEDSSTSTSGHHQQQDVGASTAASSLVSSARQSPSNDQLVRDDETNKMRPKSRAASADSLMMITLSPLSSPRVKFPIPTTSQMHNLEEPRKVVEVSNKSTITAIDLALMDKMVRKYFVDMHDKGTQSIDFDCNDDISSRSGLTRASSNKRSTMKSIAVGTEKFSRERFSLLPPTKTRSTQTKANMDNDIGVSETRRFKLGSSFGEYGPIIRGKPASISQPTTSQDEVSASMRDSSTDPVSLESQAHVEEPTTKSNTLQPATSRVQSPAINQLERRPKSPLPELVKEDTAKPKLYKVEGTKSVILSSDRPKSRQDEQQQVSVRTEERTRITQSPSDSLSSSDSNSEKSGKKKKSETSNKLVEHSSRNEISAEKSAKSLIPSVKTELRVIIEIQDSSKQQRHRSQLKSESQIVDGKLSKRMQVSTSKQVHDSAKSPRQVLQNLQAVGRQHSLMYQMNPALGGNGNKSTDISRTGRSPAAVVAANEQFLRSAASMSSLADTANGWHEVSHSTVCNELETDVNKPESKSKRKSSDRAGDLVLSSAATVKLFDDDKSAIDLHSKAATHRVDSSRQGAVEERILVQGQAKFDERDVQVANDRQTEVRKQGEILNSKDNGSGQIGRVEKQGTRAKERPFGQQSPGLLRPTSIRNLPASQSSEQNYKQSPARTIPRSQQVSGASSTPNIATSPSPTIGRTQAPLVNRQAHLEIKEETEDRRQLTRNGRLVYDDRLRERRYETSSTVGGTQSEVPGTPTTPASGGSPASPTLNGILRNSSQRNQHQQQRAQLLKPVSLPSPSGANMMASPPILFADQTSNLSASDPETMDSGFAQSGAGSSSNIFNQQQRSQNARTTGHSSVNNNTLSPDLPRQQQPRTTTPQQVNKNLSPTAITKSRVATSKSTYDPLELDNDSSNSLTFVDDDVDELIEQLGGSCMMSPQSSPAPVTGEGKPAYKGLNQNQYIDRRQSGPSRNATNMSQYKGLLAPPAAFRASEPASMNQVGLPDAPKDLLANSTSTKRLTAPLATNEANTDTELTTLLTRSRAKEQPSKSNKTTDGRRPRTKTQLEQSLVVPPRTNPAMPTKTVQGLPQPQTRQPHCKFWAQVMFESDTDSTADRQSVSSGQSNVGTANVRSAKLTPNVRPTGSRRIDERKELVSETRYTLTSDGRASGAPSNDGNQTSAQVNQGSAQVRSSNRVKGEQQVPTSTTTSQNEINPNWDYSLRVNRMRGEKVDSKVRVL